jgi:4-amino-4-deoxy-L-arabinose transferase-like glycosyltransferase
MVARNLERGSGFLRPQLDTGPFPNLFLVEPPVYASATALLRGMLGVELGAAGRLVSALATTLGAWGLYGLVRRREGAEVALLAVGAFALFPVTIRYGRAFQPDASMLGLQLAGLRFWDDHEAEGGRTRLMAGVGLLATSLALKITSAFILVPLVVCILRRPRRWKVAMAVGTLLPALSWYLYASGVLDGAGGSRASADNRGIWLGVLAASAWADPQTYAWIARFLVFRAFTPLGFVLAAWGLLGGGKVLGLFVAPRRLSNGGRSAELVGHAIACLFHGRQSPARNRVPYESKIGEVTGSVVLANPLGPSEDRPVRRLFSHLGRVDETPAAGRPAFTEGPCLTGGASVNATRPVPLPGSAPPPQPSPTRGEGDPEISPPLQRADAHLALPPRGGGWGGGSEEREKGATQSLPPSPASNERQPLSNESAPEPRRLWLVWVGSAGVALALLAGKLHHEYYWLVGAPPAAVGMARALAGLGRRGARGRGLAVTSSMAFVLLVVVQTASTWRTPEEWAHLGEVAGAVRAHVPSDAWLVAPEPLLFAADRRGCRLELSRPGAIRAAGEWGGTLGDDSPLALVEFYRTRGARFVADVRPDPGDPRRKALHEAIRHR